MLKCYTYGCLCTSFQKDRSSVHASLRVQSRGPTLMIYLRSDILVCFFTYIWVTDTLTAFFTLFKWKVHSQLLFTATSNQTLCTQRRNSKCNSYQPALKRHICLTLTTIELVMLVRSNDKVVQES